MKVTRETKLGSITRYPPAEAVLRAQVPKVPPSPYIEMLRHLTLGEMSGMIGIDDESLQSLLDALPDVPAGEERDHEMSPRDDYEGADVAAGSARMTQPSSASRYGVHEVTLAGPSHGNPFVDVALSASFVGGDHEYDVLGFYDGDGTYRVRFMPEYEGEWSFTTRSNARSLDGISGSFVCTSALPGAHGPVRVVDTFHFAHADGTPFRPFGTTAYAWNHQGDAAEEITLRTFAAAPFNKVRMCVFPKWYPHNTVEPQFDAYERKADGSFDLQRFVPEFFRHLELRIADLAALGIEADLILFHPYDKWGYCDMPASADDRYLRYLIARLGAYANVWWSLANEYDFLGDKVDADWHRIGELVAAVDPHRHLLGVHNGPRVWDHSLPWVTHASIQSQGPETQADAVDQMRERWGKPVMVDECCYEGDIEFGFGNLTGEEMTQRFWDGVVRGGYVTHGECYLHPDDVLWWGRGGELHGTSPARLAFLRDVLASAPAPLTPVPSRRRHLIARATDEWFLVYQGSRQSARHTLELPAGRLYRVELLDTWNMTIDDLGVHVAEDELVLPARPYQALRMTAAA